MISSDSIRGPQALPPSLHSRRPLLVVGCAAIVLLGVGLGLSMRRSPTAGGTLTISLGDGSRFVNPLLASTNTDLALTSQVFSGLTTRTGAGGLAPGLAQSWSVSEGGRLYTFHLRAGVRWSDGKAVASRDVAYTYRLLARKNFPTYDPEFSGITIGLPNPRTVTFRLPRPDFLFLQSTTVGVVPDHYARSRWPVGSGAYRVAGVSNSEIVLRPRSDQPAPFIGNLTFRTGSAAHARLQCRLVVGKSGAASILTTQMVGLTFNLQSLPDVRVRRAIIAALVASGYGHSPTPTYPSSAEPPSLRRFVSPGSLMSLAGWKLSGGLWTKGSVRLTLTLAASNDPRLTRVIDSTDSTLHRAHFGVRLIRTPFPNLVHGVLYPGSFDIAVTEWNFDSPDYNPGAFWASGAPLNFGHVHDGFVDRLSKRLPATSDASRRNVMRAAIGGRLISDGAALGLASDYYSCEVPSNLGGYRPPSLVTDASGLLLDEAHWYVSTKLVLRNPF